ncbi:Helix-loop-helix DNA-binding domain [Musa troglodytarum]|uniref:Helix-loop-helix DNA-binding domain n=1 Tax=Musa troglodytarum TaxID=320322 RepID=A0A9E7LB60_9LILI|nr:Helix-loop-helix DNA-binding domain [Musa troglodytarum]
MLLTGDHICMHSAIPGLEVEAVRDEEDAPLQKRARVESSAAPRTKACREKLRRDRLNDRFRELCCVLDPGKPPKADKLAVLRDATRLLIQLRVEAEKLKESNEALQDAIKNLKAEKSELRDEKTRLRCEMEQMLGGISFAGQTAAMPATNDKTFAYMPICMWPWVPPAALDTSQDHVLRPPVA